jgi:uncharacterized protein YeaO (DUF488 family)
MPEPRIVVKQAYEPREPRDGIRALVDRLAPRGLPKRKASWDQWLKILAPSTELRRWYGHDPERFPDCTRRYRGELRRAVARDARASLARGRGTLTLLTATRDLQHSEAAVLAARLQRSASVKRQRWQGK